MEEFIPVVAEKKNSDYRDVSKNDGFFRKFETNKDMTQVTKPLFFNAVFWYNYKFVSGRRCIFESCVFGKEEMRHKGKSKLMALFGVCSVWSSQNNIFRRKFFSKSVFPDPGNMN